MLDASFALRLILPGPTQAPHQELVRQWWDDSSELYAPTPWLYEMTSALCKAVRLGGLAHPQALALAHGLGMRLVSPDGISSRSAFEWTVRLKRTAAYDSPYLALAEALECELWTADRRLRRAVGLDWIRGVDSG